MLNTLIIIGRIETASQHDTRTGAKMTVYRVVTHSHERVESTGKFKDMVYHSVIAFGDAAHAAQQGDIVCIVGRVQLRKSAYNNAWEYSCVAKYITVLTEAQARELENDAADFERKLDQKARKTKQDFKRVSDVFGAPSASTGVAVMSQSSAANKTPVSGDFGW